MVNIVKLRESHPDFESTMNEVVGILRLYPDIFKSSLSRLGSIKKEIEDGTIVVEDGVIITFNQTDYRHKVSHTADIYCKPNDFVIHQIATNHSVKGGTKRVLDKFVKWCKSQDGSAIYLTVRQENERACKFYDRYGFEMVSECHWNSKEVNQKINGYIYKLKLENKNAYKFFNL